MVRSELDGEPGEGLQGKRISPEEKFGGVKEAGKMK